MVRILTEPRNALIKQFQRLFELDDVRLEFTEEALVAVAREAMRSGMGARGLRTILEETLNEVMFELPSHPEIRHWVVTEEHILQRSASTPALKSRRPAA